MRLDHVALGTRDAPAALDVLVGGLGATVLSGGEFPGFRPMQVLVGDEGAGMKVELLEPCRIDENDFLERFLARHGEGPHHLTFKVDDLAATLERVRAAGYSPVSVDLSDPQWRESFLLPSEAHGTVVQLAETTDPRRSPAEEYRYALEHGVDAEPRWWPEPPVKAPVPSYLRRVVMRTPDLAAAVAFFTGLLDGEAWGGDGAERWVEIAWPGGARLRLEERDGARPGVDRLEVEGPATAAAPTGAGGAERERERPMEPGPARELTVAGVRVEVSPLA